jgi:spermidine/putrescine transport system permease protein
MKARHSQPNLLVTLIFYLVIAFLYVPLLYLVFQTFLVSPNSLSSGFTLKWLLRLFDDPNLWEPLFNSLQIAVFSATLSVTLGTLGAVGLSPFVNTLPAFLQTLIMLPILLPEVITGLSLLLFFLLIKLPLGMTTIVIAHASFSASFVYFIMVEQMRKLDPQMEEAAQDLGAKPGEIFWQVTLPNILPGIMGAWLLAFTLSFDDFLISFFTSGSGVTTLPLKIYSLMRIGLKPEINGLAFVMIVLSTSLVVALLSSEKSRQWVLRGKG